ncbi:MAG: (5-formylfuran-3-yl)methyl phosphate synthase, partial [Pirellulales bacterium]
AGPGLLADADAVAGWIAVAHAAGMAVAAAGRLTLDEIARARGLGANVVAVRGAVCRGGRSGVVDRNLVRAASTLTAAAVGRGPLDPGYVVPGASA